MKGALGVPFIFGKPTPVDQEQVVFIFVLLAQVLRTMVTAWVPSYSMQFTEEV